MGENSALKIGENFALKEGENIEIVSIFLFFGTNEYGLAE